MAGLSSKSSTWNSSAPVLTWRTQQTVNSKARWNGWMRYAQPVDKLGSIYGKPKDSDQGWKGLASDMSYQ